MRNDTGAQAAQDWMVNTDSTNGDTCYRGCHAYFLFYFNYYYFWPHEMWDLSSPDQEETRPLLWKHRVLTIRPAGKA